MKLRDLHPIYATRIDFLSPMGAKPSLWASEVYETVTEAERDFPTSDRMIACVHRLQRLRKIFLVNAQNIFEFKVAYDEANLPMWENFTSPPVDEELQQSLADKIYNINGSGIEVAYLGLANGARNIGCRILDRCLTEKIPTLIGINDARFQDLLFQYCSLTAVSALATDFLEYTKSTTKHMVLAPGREAGPSPLTDVNKNRLFDAAIDPYRDRIQTGEIFYTATAIPTPEDAAIDEMTYEECVELFFEALDQPWKEIGSAQENILIPEFNQAEKIRFVTQEGTDFTVDIAEFTFCNSLIAKNVPGSEIFSAPRRDSASGHIVSRGRFAPPDRPNDIVENLILEFKDGRLVSWSAEKGQQFFEDAISIDEGARFIGEIAIGTNPHLRRHMVNGLLVEKIGGSFHIALGACYRYTNYMGRPVNVDNGNRSKLHWDITTLLGDIYLNDRKVMENGVFMNPACDVLNRGWQSISREKRPRYWQDYYERNRQAGRPSQISNSSPVGSAAGPL